jgi:hypothetical protein
MRLPRTLDRVPRLDNKKGVGASCDGLLDVPAIAAISMAATYRVAVARKLSVGAMPRVAKSVQTLDE